jgi:hypothetical protein
MRAQSTYDVESDASSSTPTTLESLSRRRPRRLTLFVFSGIAFLLGVVASPMAVAELSSSNWDLQATVGGACTWGRAQVDNVEDFSRSQTASRILVGVPPGCTYMSGAASNATSGHLQGAALLIRDSNGVVFAK